MWDIQESNVGFLRNELGMLGERVWGACCCWLQKKYPCTERTLKFWALGYFWQRCSLKYAPHVPALLHPCFPGWDARKTRCQVWMIQWSFDITMMGFPSASPSLFLSNAPVSAKPEIFSVWHPQLVETTGDSFMAPHLCSLLWNSNKGGEKRPVGWFTRQEIPINHSNISKGLRGCSEFPLVFPVMQCSDFFSFGGGWVGFIPTTHCISLLFYWWIPSGSHLFSVALPWPTRRTSGYVRARTPNRKYKQWNEYFLEGLTFGIKRKEGFRNADLRVAICSGKPKRKN